MIGLDIETDTTVDGLDPQIGAIVDVALVTATSTMVFDDPDEANLLRAVDAALAEIAAEDPGVLVTWNGSGFDLPFISTRAELLGVATGFRLESESSPTRRPHHLSDRRERVRGTWHGHRHLDGYLMYRADVGRALPVSCGLKPMARLVGLPIVEVDRAAIHLLSAEERREYVASDAFLARELVLRRADADRWIDQLPASSGS